MVSWRCRGCSSGFVLERGPKLLDEEERAGRRRFASATGMESDRCLGHRTSSMADRMDTHGCPTCAHPERLGTEKDVERSHRLGDGVGEAWGERTMGGPVPGELIPDSQTMR